MNVRDQMSGDTPMEALIQGWDHQFRNFHNTPILQMLAGKKERIGSRTTFVQTMRLLLLQSSVYKLNIESFGTDLLGHLVDVQWSDGLKAVLDFGASEREQGRPLQPAAKPTVSVTWKHVVRSIQKTFDLIVLVSKWMTKHGNVAVDEMIAKKYVVEDKKEEKEEREGKKGGAAKRTKKKKKKNKRFNSHHDFLGLPDVQSLLHQDDSGHLIRAYDRKELDDLLFAWHDEHVLRPLLLSMVNADTIFCSEQSEGGESSSRSNLIGRFTSPMHAAAYLGYGRGVNTLHEMLNASNGGKECLRQWDVQKDGKGRTPLQSAQAGRHVEVIQRMSAAAATTNVAVEEVVVKENVEVEEVGEVVEVVEVVEAEDFACELDRIDWDAKNGTRLFEQYYFSNTPVLIRSHDVVKKWESFRHWRNLTYFQQKFPTKKFHAFGQKEGSEGSEMDGISLLQQKSFVLTLPEFVTMLNFSSSSSSSTTTSSSSSSSSSPPPPWIVETDTKTFVQGSEQDAVFKNHIRKMTGRFEFFEKILKRTTSIGQYSNYQFMIAPKGTGASPHFHNSALNILFTGKKMWALFPPSHSFYDTTPVRDWFERERAAATSSSRKNSRRRRKYMRCIQRPSEIVYVPDGWGHAVISLVDTSIGLAHLYNA